MQRLVKQRSIFTVKENIEISINWVIEKLKIAPHDNLQQEILNRVFPSDS